MDVSQRRAALRAVALLWHLISGMTEAISHRLRRGTEWHQTAPGKAAINRWMQRLTRVLGLKVEAARIPADTPTLLVANHISWLDIIAIASVCPARFLAKDTVRRWPFIGSLMALSGTLFIRRGSLTDLHATNQTLTHALRAGQRIAIFPEGTTTDGRDMKPFRPGLFEAARQAGCEVQPVAVSYRRDGALDPLAPYIDDDAFITHLWRILGASETCVHLHFCAPLLPSDAPRKAIAESSQAHIRAALNSGVSTPALGSELLVVNNQVWQKQIKRDEIETPTKPCRMCSAQRSASDW